MGNSEGKSLWGGRFESSTDETFKKFNRSFGFDARLFEADIEGSVGHCDGLVAAGVISGAEGALIKSALNELAKRAVADRSFLDDEDCEDVHSFIEKHLIASIGDVGRKVHTGRSRNDQVTTALRIWLRRELDAASEAVRKFQAALVESAERHRDAVIPGYTHLQRAQPILWAHWCLAYFEMLERDRERISDARKRVNIMPLGSGAISGSGFRVDRAGVASSLGFDGITRNSLDAVSDRDFVIEAASVAATAMMHLSRFAEDLIIYSSAEFGLIRLGDAISTGSSLMPQKKNPDALELIRGKSARVFGHHAALLTLMKGLPLAYNKDMQEDKEALFDTLDTLISSLEVSSIVLRNIDLDEDRAKNAATVGFLNATELADYLVRKGLPFRTAHDIVGGLVLKAIESECELSELSLETLKGFSDLITEDVYTSLDIRSALCAKDVAGGTAPSRVAEAIEDAKRRIL